MPVEEQCSLSPTIETVLKALLYSLQILDKVLNNVSTVLKFNAQIEQILRAIAAFCHWLIAQISGARYTLR